MSLVRRRGGVGGGFTLGPEQNVFTGADRAAAEAARDAYATANPSWLTTYNNDTSLNIRLEYTSGSDAVAQFQVRNSAGDDWLDNSSATGVQGDPGVDGMDISQFSSISDRDAFFSTNPNLLEEDLPISVVVENNTIEMQVWNGAASPPSYSPGTDAILWLPGSIRSGTSSFELADSQAITAGGDNVLLEERVRDISVAPIGQILGNHQDSSARTVSNFPVSRKYTPGEGQPPAQSAPSPAAPSGSIPFDTSFAVGAENTALFGLEYIPEESYTGFIEYNLVNTDADRTVYTARQQVTLVAGTNYTQWFRSPVSSRAGANVRGRLFKDDRTILNVRPRTDDANLPFTNSHLRRYEDEVVLTESSAASAHPVTLRRDMPSEDDAQALVDASLNDNSALWVVGNDQLSSSNRADATLVAQRAGFLDLDGNEIPTAPVAANTIQMRSGTTVRIFAANDYRVVNSPVFESDISNGGGGMSPTTPQPSFERFEFQSQPTSVAPGTVVSGLKTFLIRIDRPDLLTGHLKITQGTDTLTENTIVPTVTSAGVPINSVTLTNAGDTETFTIEAQKSAGGMIRAHITIRAYQPHELAYWGIRTSNDFATVALTSLTSEDITTSNTFDVQGAFASGSFIGILVPSTHDAREITTFNLPAKDLFARNDGARTINSVDYILYTLENEGGVSGTAAYVVEV